MSFNIIDAAKLIDEKELSPDDIKLLIETREGVEKREFLERKGAEALTDKFNLVRFVPLSHPQVSYSIYAAIPNERGTKMLNLLDARYKEEQENAPRTVKVPENVPVKEVRSDPAKTVKAKNNTRKG